jgi:putative hydrolase of the HAD superfamily
VGDQGLILDIGGVVIRTPFELLGPIERQRGLPDRTLGPRGPFDGGADLEFAQVGDGTLTERAYWQRRAELAATHLGTAPDTRSLMHVLFDLPVDEIVRPQTAELAARAREAGFPVGFLTNDLADFHGDEWLTTMPILGGGEHLVDGSLTGFLKPHRRAYELGAAALGLPPDQIVFVDDQPANIAGARDVGLQTVWFDVRDPAASVAAAWAALTR